MVLKTSMWAKRHYVQFKRWQPKAGRWADWGLRPGAPSGAKRCASTARQSAAGRRPRAPEGPIAAAIAPSPSPMPGDPEMPGDRSGAIAD